MTRDGNRRERPRRKRRRRSQRSGGGPVSVRETSGHLVADREPDVAPAPSCRFTVDDEEWIARCVGEGCGGTGGMGATYLLAVRFFRAAEPDTAVREILVPRGRFDCYYADELRELFQNATPLDAPS